jgi:hypothetical protein
MKKSVSTAPVIIVGRLGFQRRKVMSRLHTPIDLSGPGWPTLSFLHYLFEAAPPIVHFDGWEITDSND